jgi:hypothetical protein
MYAEEQQEAGQQAEGVFHPPDPDHPDDPDAPQFSPAVPDNPVVGQFPPAAPSSGDEDVTNRQYTEYGELENDLNDLPGAEEQARKAGEKETKEKGDPLLGPIDDDDDEDGGGANSA